jgi:hypothetical protein
VGVTSPVEIRAGPMPCCLSVRVDCCRLADAIRGPEDTCGGCLFACGAVVPVCCTGALDLISQPYGHMGDGRKQQRSRGTVSGRRGNEPLDRVSEEK